MNLSHRLLQLGKTASDKLDQALPGFGLVGVIYLAMDGILTSIGLGSPFNKEFWQQYGAELARGDLGRYAGTTYIAAATTSLVLGLISKIPEYKAVATECAQTALGVLAATGGCLLFLAALTAEHKAPGTAITAIDLIAANGLLLSGTKLGRQTVDRAINFVKRRVVEFNTPNAMGNMFAIGSLPMLGDAIKPMFNHQRPDIGLGTVAIGWATAGYLLRRQLKQQQAANPAINH